MVITGLIFVLVLGLIIFVHELGHFVAARKSGATVEEFGFGFPPRIVGVKRGGTLYSLNWIPFGGFVKIKGEGTTGHDEPGSFTLLPVWRRAIIVSAGVIMNFVLAYALITVGLTAGLPAALPDEPIAGALVRDERIQLTQIEAGSPAATAGLKLGDGIVTIDGQSFSTVEAVQEYTSVRVGVPMDVTVARSGTTEHIAVTPADLDSSGRGRVGVGLARTGLVSYPWYRALIEGGRATYRLTTQIVTAFSDVVGGFVRGTPGDVQVSGPVGIAVLTGEVTQLGPIYLLQFTALLSINLALINFLPFPALDGGRLLFLFIEQVRRRPVNRRVEAIIHNVGFSVLLLVIVLVTWGDLRRYSEPITSFFKRLL